MFPDECPRPNHHGMMTRRRVILLLMLMFTILLGFIFRERVGIGFTMVQRRLIKRTVGDRLIEFGPAARVRMKGGFTDAGVSYPPSKVTLLILKEERRVEVYARNSGPARFVLAYPILAASGTAGPKLREGDNQVPEGLYEIESLNPNSAYHVSLRVNYPNAFDRAQAQIDRRIRLGGDIMIHGKDVSIGCVAIGDRAAEDLFTLAADTGLENLKVVLSPIDFRKGRPLPRQVSLPPWSDHLYAQIRASLQDLPLPE